jgi:hypothetical protein
MVSSNNNNLTLDIKKRELRSFRPTWGPSVFDNETKEDFTEQLKKKSPLPSFEQNIPLYIHIIYPQFASHVNEPDGLKGLKFISILRFGFSGSNNSPYL